MNKDTKKDKKCKRIGRIGAYIIAVITTIFVYFVAVNDWTPKPAATDKATTETSQVADEKDKDGTIKVLDKKDKKKEGKEYKNIESAHDSTNFERLIIQINEYTKELRVNQNLTILFIENNKMSA